MQDTRNRSPFSGSSANRGAGMLAEIVENTGEVVYRYRLWPTLGYEYVSESVVALLGYTADEHYADPHLAQTVIYPDDAGLARSILDAPHKQELDLMLRMVRRDGRIVLTNMRCFLTRSAEGRALQVDGVVRDVTRREED